MGGWTGYGKDTIIWDGDIAARKLSTPIFESRGGNFTVATDGQTITLNALDGLIDMDAGNVQIDTELSVSITTVTGVSITGGNITLASGVDIQTATSVSGTMLATSSLQLLGFWGATPIARPSAINQTSYSTASATVNALTATAVSETASTNVGPYGYTTQAQADSIPVELNDLIDDLANVKQNLNSLIDKLQSAGLIG